jgi:hypothetical protein
MRLKLFERIPENRGRERNRHGKNERERERERGLNERETIELLY